MSPPGTYGEGFKTKMVISLVSMLLYSNTLNHGFVYDDRPSILENPVISRVSSLSSLVTTDYWGVPLTHSGSHKSYRPLTSLTFRLNWSLAGPNPLSFHLTNILLHGLVTALFTHLVSSLSPHSPGLGTLAGLIFSVLPVHCEAVAGVVGRADILAALLSLLTLITHHHTGWSLATPLLATLAMLAKEQGVTVLAVCCLLDIVNRKISQQEKQRSLLRISLSLIIILSLRAILLGGELPTFSRADNPASHSDSRLTRTLTFLYLPAFNLILLLCPSTLSYDWSMSSIPLVTSLADSRNIVSLAFYSLLVCFTSKLLLIFYQQFEPTTPVHLCSLWKTNLSKTRAAGSRSSSNTPGPSRHLRRSQIETISIIALALSLIILPFLPAANIFFYVGFVVAERLLYLPSLGYSLLVAVGVRKLSRSSPLLSRLGLAILLLAAGLRTVTRNMDWRNEETLFKSGLTVNPAKSFSNLGNILYAKGQLQDSEIVFKEALRCRPNMADTHYNLGILLQHSGRLSEAVSAYETAIKFRPKLGLAYLNLGITLNQLGRKDDAIKILDSCSKLDDNGLKDPKANANGRISAVFHLGKLLLESGEPRRAISVLLTGLKTDGAREKILNLLGEAHQSLGESQAAEDWYNEAVKLNPHYVSSHIMMAKMLAKNTSRDQEAESWFLRAKFLGPSEPNVYVHYGLYLMDRQRFTEAAQHLGQAARLSPQDYDNVFNAAVAYRECGQLEVAESFYRKSVQIRPMEASSHMNLGALLHLRGKLEEAEKEYIQAWSLQPGNLATRTNLERLHRVMRKKNINITQLVDF